MLRCPKIIGTTTNVSPVESSSQRTHTHFWEGLESPSPAIAGDEQLPDNRHDQVKAKLDC
jgi:hypothetical protein